MIWVLLFFPFCLMAQVNETALKLYKIAAFAEKEMSHLNKLNSLTSCASPLISPQEKEEAQVCSLDIPKRKVLPIKISKFQDLPKEWQTAKFKHYFKKKNSITLFVTPRKLAPGKKYETNQGGVRIGLEGMNDNIFYGLMGLIINDKHDGDDHGSTSDLALVIKKTLKNNLTLTARADSKLYTQRHFSSIINENDQIVTDLNFPQEGTAFIRNGRNYFEAESGRIYTYDSNWNSSERYWMQQFNNIVEISFGVDNIQQDKNWFYQGQVGVTKTDSNNERGFLYGSGIQKDWHNIARYNFINFADKTPDLSGFAASFILGVQKNFDISQNCRLRGKYGIKGRVSSLGLDSHVGSQATADLFVQKPNSPKFWKFSFAKDYTLHKKQDRSNGHLVEMDLSLSRGGRRLALEMGMKARLGDLPDFPRYDNDKDPKFTAKIIVFLGGQRSRKP